MHAPSWAVTATVSVDCDRAQLLTYRRASPPAGPGQALFTRPVRRRSTGLALSRRCASSVFFRSVRACTLPAGPNVPQAASVPVQAKLGPQEQRPKTPEAAKKAAGGSLGCFGGPADDDDGDSVAAASATEGDSRETLLPPGLVGIRNVGERAASPQPIQISVRACGGVCKGGLAHVIPSVHGQGWSITYDLQPAHFL